MLTQEENQLLTQVGKGTPTGEYIRRFWIPVLLTADLPGPDCDPLRLKIMGEELVAFRDTNGNIGIIDNYCPHRRASLFFGRNEECGLRCVYHGWKFDIEGNCVDMPSEPAESNFKDKVKIAAYPAQERGGLVWTYMGPSDRTPAMPDLELFNLPDSHCYAYKHIQESNFVQLVEGEIDSSHVGFLHSNLDEPVTSKTATSWYLKYRSGDRTPKFFIREAPYGVLIGARRAAEVDSYYWRVTQWLTPFYTMIPRAPEDALNFRAWVPIDDESTWVFQVSANPFRPLNADELEKFSHTDDELVPGTHRLTLNKDNDYMLDREVQRKVNFTGIPLQPVRMGRGQDGAMTESMGRVVDRSREHLGTSDSAIIAVRRSLLREVRDFQEGVEPHAANHGEVYRVRSGSAVLPHEVPFDEGEKAQAEGFVLT